MKITKWNQRDVHYEIQETIFEHAYIEMNNHNQTIAWQQLKNQVKSQDWSYIRINIWMFLNICNLFQIYV